MATTIPAAAKDRRAAKEFNPNCGPPSRVCFADALDLVSVWANWGIDIALPVVSVDLKMGNSVMAISGGFDTVCDLLDRVRAAVDAERDKARVHIRETGLRVSEEEFPW